MWKGEENLQKLKLFEKFFRQLMEKIDWLFHEITIYGITINIF